MSLIFGSISRVLNHCRQWPPPFLLCFGLVPIVPSLSDPRYVASFHPVIFQEEQGSSGSGAALESACAGATNAASELERALVMAARDQARDLAPLAEEAKRLAADLSHIGNPPRILGTCRLVVEWESCAMGANYKAKMIAPSKAILTSSEPAGNRISNKWTMIQP